MNGSPQVLFVRFARCIYSNYHEFLVHMLQFLLRMKLKGTQNCNFHLMSKKIATFFLDYICDGVESKQQDDVFVE